MQPNGKPRAKRFVKIAFIGLLAIIILAATVWINRYPLAEWAARQSFEEQGIEADVSIKSITLSKAIIENVSLSHNNTPFFTAKRITAEYNWRKALKMKLGRVLVDAPTLALTIDESGTFTDGWMPQSEGGGNITALFPENGITVTSGQVNIVSPFGDISAAVNADILSPTAMQGDIRIAKTQVSIAQFKGDIALEVSGQVADNDINADFDLRSDTLTYREYVAAGLHVKGTGHTQINAPFDSPQLEVAVNMGSANMPDIQIGETEMTWLGTVGRAQSESGLPNANGSWSLNINAARLVNDVRRRRLASSLTLNETLTGITSTAPLAPQLLSIAEDLMRQSDISARGTLNQSEAETRIALTEPALFATPRNALTVSPITSKELLTYAPPSGEIVFNFNAALTGSKNITLSGAKLTAQSTTDQNVSNIQTFTANVVTKEPWRAKTPEGRVVRLAPMKAHVSYDARQPERRTTIIGALDFDGDVPGGYASGIKASGTLGIGMTPDVLTTRFTPRKNEPVFIDRLETVTDWVLEDAEFTVAPNQPLYRRTAQSANLTAQVRDGKGRLQHRTDPLNLDVTFASADVKGTLLDSGQDWDTRMVKARLKSDTIPSPGTDISAPTAIISARLTPTNPPDFTIKSPQTHVKTQLVQAAGLSVDMRGTPSDLRVDYGEGQIKFSAGELPVLPLRGDIRYINGRWAGAAETYLPRATKTPISITYTFGNGVGTADVSFVDLPFKPASLQPKHLVSAFSGKVSRVEGLVSSNILLSFGADQPLQSSGTAVLKDMNFGTLPGPISGMNAELSFSSFFPLQTNGVQLLTVKSFDPGFPLENGTVEFEIVPDGINLHSANWPIGDGQLSLDPTIWRYNAPQNRVVLRADNISLGEFFKNIGGGRLYATGNVNGVLPVVIEGVKVNVENGSLAVRDGGVIQYSSPQTNQAGEDNQIAGYAFDALKNFEYQELEAALNGPLDGPMRLSMLFSGSNPEVLAGSEFKFNVGVEGELMNIMRSFKIGQDISAKILEQVQSNPSQSPPEQP